jgi:hypothetical protein
MTDFNSRLTDSRWIIFGSCEGGGAPAATACRPEPQADYPVKFAGIPLILREPYCPGFS